MAGAINLPHRGIDDDAVATLERERTLIVYCWGPGCNGAQKGAARFAALRTARRKLRSVHRAGRMEFAVGRMGAYSAVLVRSTWDYHRCADAFVAWAVAVEAAGTSFWNPAPVIRWNADKRYLAELESAGVPIVPTEWVARGGEAELGPLLERRGWREAVVKPAVGATSYRTC